MSKSNGTSSIIAGLLIVPIILLVKAIDFSDAPRYVPSHEYNQSSENYDSISYTQPRAEVSEVNLKANGNVNFPTLEKISPIAPLSLLSEPPTTPLSLLSEREEQNYIGKPGCGENGSCYGDLNASGVSKEVFVNGYYRSDGTYVRSHYRSRPGK